MFKRIFVALRDPSERNSSALEKAALLAEAGGADLQLFHDLADPIIVEGLKPGAARLKQLRAEGSAAVMHKLEQLADPYRKRGVRVSIAATWDYPAHEAIVRQAVKSGADLVVIEPRHRHRMASLLGYTDWQLMRDCPVPLLVVKSATPWKRLPILAAVDPSHGYSKPSGLDNIILKTGSELSKLLGAPLHALHAYQVLPGLMQAGAAEDAQLAVLVRTQAEKRARELLGKLLKGRSVDVSRQHLLEAHPVEAISTTAERLQSSMIVMGSISRSGLKRLFIGNTAERLLDEVSCDVLVVRPARFRNRVPARSRGSRLVSSIALPPPPMF